VGSGAEAPRFPGELPPIWNVPFHPNPFFTGRGLLLAELLASLTASEVTGRRVALTGLGGVGKSQLAVEYAYRRRADFDLVWWVRAAQPTSLLADYAALASQPRLAAELGLAPETSQETAMAAVRAWLEHQQRWLLVFDNAVEPAALVDLLPRSGIGQVVITSRTGIGWEQFASPVPVEVLAPADAAGFLLTRTKQSGPQATVAATTLAGTLGGLPLALEQAGAFIAASGTITLAGYAELFATQTRELLRRGQPVGYQHTVATTWSLALETLQQSAPAAVGLLTLAAFLAPDDLPQHLLVAHAEVLPEPLAAADPLTFADAVAALRRYSLIRVVGDGLFVHRLLQTVVRMELDAAAEGAWASAAVRLVNAGFPSPSYEVATWPESERLLPHALAVAEHSERLSVEPEVWLRLQAEAATYLWSRGQYRQAIALDEQTLGVRRRVLGDDHPDTLMSMNNLAEARRAIGDLQGAHDLHEQTMAGFRRVLGDDHPNTLTSMSNLAAVRRELDEL
jgi:hypothetical protein